MYINYSVEAEWSIGGDDRGEHSYDRLTAEQRMTIIKAVWDAVFKVKYDGEDENGSVMGNIILKETVFDEDGVPRTKVTVYDPNEDKGATV